MPLIKGIHNAKKSVEILIFRFDRTDLERALVQAASRGVFVHALIAYTNRGGEKGLRDLEMRLLAAGITVARTADDLVRYHGKMLIIDRRDLYVLAFNYTYLDVEHSRSFGLITKHRKLVQEAVKLFEADFKRQPYMPGSSSFVVSPANARNELSEFLKGAKTELLIYDPKIGDPAMLRILEARANAGVEIKVIGRVTRKSDRLAVHRLVQPRLHTRMIVRDRAHVFIGSQSLRTAELDARREVGLMFRDPKVAARLIEVFQEDWAATEHASSQETVKETMPAAKVAKKIAKAVAKDLPPVTPVLEQIVRQVVGGKSDLGGKVSDLEQSVKVAVQEAVAEAVRETVDEVVEQDQATATLK
jgi:cardiolipin synthase